MSIYTLKKERLQIWKAAADMARKSAVSLLPMEIPLTGGKLDLTRSQRSLNLVGIFLFKEVFPFVSNFGFVVIGED